MGKSNKRSFSQVSKLVAASAILLQNVLLLTPFTAYAVESAGNITPPQSDILTEVVEEENSTTENQNTNQNILDPGLLDITSESPLSGEDIQDTEKSESDDVATIQATQSEPIMPIANDVVPVNSASDLKAYLEDGANSSKTYQLTSTISITADDKITIAEGTFTVDLNGYNITTTANPAFTISNTTNFTLTNNNPNETSNFEGNTSANSRAFQLASSANDRVLTINNIKFTNFKHSWGAVLNVTGEAEHKPEIKITNSTFTKNTSTSSQGGAFTISNTNLTLDHDTFTENTGARVGAIFLTNGTLKISNNTFNSNLNTGNSATANGGAINLQNVSAVFQDNTFENNTSLGNGGVIYATAPALSKQNFNDYVQYTNEFTNNTFKNNSAASGGGVIYTNNIDNTFTNNEFTDNKITDTGSASNGNGGAIYTANGRNTLTSNIITGNMASSKDGAIYFSAQNSAYFEDNASNIVNFLKANPYSITLDGNKINNNKAGDDSEYCKNNSQSCAQGGGIYLSTSGGNESTSGLPIVIDIQSGEFIGNQAGDGGAIWFGLPWSYGNLQLNKTIITGNQASRGGGIWLCPQAASEMHATLGGAIYNNTATGDTKNLWDNATYSQTLNSAGDDIYYEGTQDIEGVTDSEYPPRKFWARSRLKVVSRTWIGSKIDWYKDEQNKRFDLASSSILPANDPYLIGPDGDGTTDLTALHDNIANVPTDSAIIIQDNIATRRGGGIFTNNVVNIGVNEDMDVSVDKKFVYEGEEYTEGELMPKSIEIELHQTDVNGMDRKIEDAELNASNNWHAEFTQLPSRDENGDFSYYFTEVGNNQLISSESTTGGNNCTRPKDAAIENGDNYQCTITLTNSLDKPEEPEEPENPQEPETPVTPDSPDTGGKLNKLLLDEAACESITIKFVSLMISAFIAYQALNNKRVQKVIKKIL